MPERFLLSRLSALGDTVCSLPAAMALKQGFPECHITWAVDPRFAGIVECCEAVDEVVRVKPSLKTIPTYPESFDATLDLQGLLKSALCVMRAKAKRKVGYHWQREGSWLFSGRVQPDPTSFHVVDQYVDVARAVGGVMDRAEFGLRPREEDLVSVRGKLTEAGVEGKFVAVNAGAGWATKRWPAEHFAALIAELPYVPCVLIGGPGDREVAEAVRAGAPGAPSLVGETSVRELVALLSLASAHVGGDTGSTHIAAALGVPAVGLYSLTRPRRSCPYGQIERCHYDPAGLSHIRPEAVLKTVREALA